MFMRMNRVGIIAILCLLTASGSVWIAPVNAAVASPYTPLPNPVEHPMTVRVALIGMSRIDLDLLRWNLEPEIATTIQVSNQIGLSDVSYGTKFKIMYEFKTVSDETVSELKEYLKSISETKKVPTHLRNKETGVYSCWNWWQQDSKRYATLDALKTEEWISNHVSDLGGMTNDGYLILVGNLSDISKLYHYYERTYYDLDKGSESAKYYKRPEMFPIVNWMFSWGGRERFYFLDLSAGDSKFDYSGICHVPIQDFEKRPSWGDIKLKKDTSTVTEYVADYISEAVRNLFVPSYVYAPTFSSSYKIAIHVFDDTGKVAESDIADYISVSTVKEAFERVIPHASWDVSVNVHKLGDDSELAKVVDNSKLFTEKTKGTFGDRIFIDYYDYRQTYYYLQSHLSRYVQSVGEAVVLPVFAFILKSSSRFAWTWREEIGSRTRVLDGQDMTFGGISLGDMIMIGKSERSLFAFGYGLTQTTIHELGHSIGLMHPHSFGWTEDYVSSAMSYVTYEYGFSQFDADAIQRAHADFFLSQVQRPIEISVKAPMHQEAKDLLQQAKSDYDSALASYSKKDYKQALTDLRNISQLLDRAFEAETKAIQDKSAQTSVTSDEARQLMQRANDFVASAKDQKNAGDIGSAYQLLAEASASVDDAVIVESQAQHIQSLASDLEKTRSMLPIYAIIGLAVGLAIGCGVMFVILKRRIRTVAVS